MKPLRDKKVWLCLDCQVGSIRGTRTPTYVSWEDAQEYLQDRITLEELMD